MDLTYLEQRIERTLGVREHIKKEWAAAKETLLKCRQQQEGNEQALKLMQKVAAETQRVLETRLSDIINSALSCVFDNPYDCRVQVVLKRGKTEIEIRLFRENKEVYPLTGSGGGVADMITFSQRAACLSISNPARRKILIMDEPLKGLSKGYRELAADFIQTMAERLQIQIILVTHDEEFMCGKVISL